MMKVVVAANLLTLAKAMTVGWRWLVVKLVLVAAVGETV